MIDIPPSDFQGHPRLDPGMENLSWVEIMGANGKTAYLKCPNGHAAGLWDHEVADDGTVSPSVGCPEDGCNFHEFVKLIGWKP